MMTAVSARAAAELGPLVGCQAEAIELKAKTLSMVNQRLTQVDDYLVASVGFLYMMEASSQVI